MLGATIASGNWASPADGNATFAPVDLGEPAVAVTAGAYHSCALLASGAVRCWGWNDYGQLGGANLPPGGSPASAATTVDIPTAKAIAATGAFHSCAVLETGSVACWGQDDAGQLGVMRDPTAGSVVPGKLVDLGRGRSARSVAAGASHTCALLDDFSVKCWGYNAHGELGIGDSLNRGDDETLGDDLPVVALGRDPVSTLTVGANHACAIQSRRNPVLGRQRLRASRRRRQPGSGRRLVTSNRSGPSRDFGSLIATRPDQTGFPDAVLGSAASAP